MIASPKAASQLFCKSEEVIFGRARNKMNKEKQTLKDEEKQDILNEARAAKKPNKNW
jgi:hypothetical protein